MPVGGTGVVALDQCATPLVEPAAAAGPYALPDLVWSRVSQLVWGEQRDPPLELPSETVPQWVEDFAMKATDHAIIETEGVPGARQFVARWLDVASPGELLVDWQRRLARSEPVADLLLNVSIQFDVPRLSAFCEPAFLSAHPEISQRGKVMYESLFGGHVPPMPPNTLEELPPRSQMMTRRDYLTSTTTAPMCVNCHELINPLGHSLEGFDEAGEYRTMDAGQVINAQDTYELPLSGSMVTFGDIEELAPQLAKTCDVRLGVADRFLELALATYTPGVASKAVDRERMHWAAIHAGGTFQALIRAYARTEAALRP